MLYGGGDIAVLPERYYVVSYTRNASGPSYPLPAHNHPAFASVHGCGRGGGGRGALIDW